MKAVIQQLYWKAVLSTVKGSSLYDGQLRTKPVPLDGMKRETDDELPWERTDRRIQRVQRKPGNSEIHTG